MSLPQAVAAGLAGEKLSRVVTGTDEVCASRSAVATGAGALLGGVSAGTIAVGASAVGATALATAAAPIVVPVAVVAGAVGLIRSLFD